MAWGTFERDLDVFVDPQRPVALSRFHDGEYHVLAGEPYNARSGWRLNRPSWLRERLLASLCADLPDYWVGISPPCDWPRGTAYFRRHLATQNVTYATVFWHHNFSRFLAAMRSGPLSRACIVASGKADYKVPRDGVTKPWPLDELVDALLAERRPILVAAGPCANLIVHEYWKKSDPQTRQTILDVGSAIDLQVHGRKTRDYHETGNTLRDHRCSWDSYVPWSPSPPPRLQGWRAYLSRSRPPVKIDIVVEKNNSETRFANLKRRQQDAKPKRRTQPATTTGRTNPPQKPKHTSVQQPAVHALRGTSLSGVLLHDDLVAVSIPTWQTPQRLLERSIRSILDGAHRNIRVFCIGDGEDVTGLPSSICDDPRFFTLRSDERRGPYFIHDAVVRSRAAGYFAVQDADDTSHKNRIARQISAVLSCRADAAFCQVTEVRKQGAPYLSKPNTLPSNVLAHRTDHFGVFSVQALLELGGYHGGFEVGFDTLLTCTTTLLGRTCVLSEPLYSRYHRGGSLTTSADRGHKTAFREERKRQMETIYAEVYKATASSRTMGIQALLKILRERTKPHASARDALVDQIRAELDERSIETPPACPALIAATLAGAPAYDGRITDELGQALYQHCETQRFRRILDIGGSVATFMFALYAARHSDVQVITIVHDKQRLLTLRHALISCGLEDAVQLRRAPARDYFKRDNRYRWYGIDLVKALDGVAADFVFVDPADPSTGIMLEPTLWHEPEALRRGTQLWVYGGADTSVRQTVAQWQKDTEISASLAVSTDPRGVWKLETA